MPVVLAVRLAISPCLKCNPAVRASVFVPERRKVQLLAIVCERERARLAGGIANAVAEAHVHTAIPCFCGTCVCVFYVHIAIPPRLKCNPTVRASIYTYVPERRKVQLLAIVCERELARLAGGIANVEGMARAVRLVFIPD